MLAGRESLIRLVGKRRRKLPRDFLLLDPLQHLPLSLSLSQPPSLPNDAGGVSSLEKGSTPVDGGGGLGENGGEVVCRRSIQGVDCSVNSHLGMRRMAIFLLYFLIVVVCSGLFGRLMVLRNGGDCRFVSGERNQKEIDAEDSS